MASRMDGVTCIGGATVDRKYRAKDRIQPGTSNPVTSGYTFGGVARNVAENIARLGVKASLVSAVGDDEFGRAILAEMTGLGIDTRHVAIVPDRTTAEYVAILQPDGDLAIGLADMDILDSLSVPLIRRAWGDLHPSWAFADCNVPPEALEDLLDQARRRSAMLVLDAVSVPKALRLPHDLTGVGLLFLNLDEARAFLDKPTASSEEAVDTLLGRGAERVVLTLGDSGLVAADRSGPVRVGAAKAQVVDATGAGDALIAVTLVAMMNGSPLAEAAWLGAVAAALTLESAASVRPDLSLALLETATSRSSHVIY